MKAFTDVKQGKILKDILPVESADMCWRKIYDENHMMSDYRVELIPYKLCGFGVPCWSLAALFNYLQKVDCFPDILVDDHSVEMSVIYYDDEEGKTLHSLYKISVKKETFIDACVEMIIKLKEQKLL